MLPFLGLLLVSSVASGYPGRHTRQAQTPIPILSFINEHNYDGSYRYSYETGNGISVSEEGFLKNGGQGEGAQSARGSYSYPAPDGQLIRVTWYADETGFHAEGDHLPKSPAGGLEFPKKPPTASPQPPDVPIPIIPVAGVRPRG